MALGLPLGVLVQRFAPQRPAFRLPVARQVSLKS